MSFSVLGRVRKDNFFGSNSLTRKTGKNVNGKFGKERKSKPMKPKKNK